MPKWKKLKSGEWAYGGVKFSKAGIGICITMAAIAIMFAVAHYNSELFLVDVDYPTFEECEATNNTDRMCKALYYFCHTYDTGDSICHYHDETLHERQGAVGDSQLIKNPEDYDFLPPAKFILPFVQWAEARSEDEPVCYTSACEKALAARGGIQDTYEEIEPVELTPQEYNKLVQQKRLEVDRIEQELIDTERDVQEWEIRKEAEYRVKVKTAEREFEDAEDDMNDKETEYRHAMDVKARTQADIDEQERTYNEYTASVKVYNTKQRALTVAENEYDKYYNEYLSNASNLKVLNDKLKELIDELALVRINANLVHREYQFIGITLSDTCKRMIEGGYPTNCPTYRELRAMFDNTIPIISGDFTDLGYDIARDKPKYNQHWKFYQQLKSWKIVAVDPDADLAVRSVHIVVQPRGFDYVEKIGATNKDPSIDNTLHERYIWSDIKVDDRCSEIMVGPDMALITEAINYVLQKCKGDLEIKKTIDIPQTEYNPYDSPNWHYGQWLEQVKLACVNKC
jgi:hypothetical protein